MFITVVFKTVDLTCKLLGRTLNLAPTLYFVYKMCYNITGNKKHAFC